MGAKVAMFDQYANKHKDAQGKNPFTSGLSIEKPKFSKEEYGRYVITYYFFFYLRDIR